jgi:acyl-CoA dehydrogenase
LERAFVLSSQSEPVFQKIKAASRAGKLPQDKPERLLVSALEAEVITTEEVELIRAAEIARNEAIQVDAFTLEEYQQKGQPIGTVEQFVTPLT